MNRDVRDRWVAALRSDRYAQGTGRLTSVDPDGSTTHCCLGVLCELAVDAGVPVVVVESSYVRTYDDELNYLPRSVRDWAGLDRCPVVRVEDQVVRLADLNDGTDDWETHDLAALADLIEEQL